MTLTIEDPTIRAQLALLLTSALTLHGFEETLAASELGEAFTRPQCWGLFDGFRGRPQSVAGLSMRGNPSRKLTAEYEAAHVLGAELRRERQHG